MAISPNELKFITMEEEIIRKYGFEKEKAKKIVQEFVKLNNAGGRSISIHDFIKVMNNFNSSKKPSVQRGK